MTEELTIGHGEGGQPLTLAVPADLSHHVTLLGVTGSGKTTTAQALLAAALRCSLPIVVIDAKAGGLRTVCHRLAARHATAYAEVGQGPECFAYDPCGLGSPAQVADKLVASFSHGANGQIYRVIGQQLLAVVVGALRLTEGAVTLPGVIATLNQVSLAGLAHRVRDSDGELAETLLSLAAQRGVAADAAEGLRARLGSLRFGEFGGWFSAERPALDMAAALVTRQLTYVGLPAMAVSNDTALMARVLIQDLKQAAFARLRGGAGAPALVLLDEFAALDDPEQISDLLRQAREAGVMVVVSTQHLPRAHGLRSALLGAGVVIAHRVVHDDALEVSHLIGDGASPGPPTSRTARRRLVLTHEPAVVPSRLTQLGCGQAVIACQVGRRRVAELQVEARSA